MLEGVFDVGVVVHLADEVPLLVDVLVARVPSGVGGLGDERGVRALVEVEPDDTSDSESVARASKAPASL